MARRPLNRDVYNEQLHDIRELESWIEEHGGAVTPFVPSRAKQIRFKEHLTKANDYLVGLYEYKAELEKEERKRILEQNQYAEIVYNNIMSAVEEMKLLSSRRQYNGWWVVKSFVQENYSRYGASFITTLSESPMFTALTDPREMYDVAKSEGMAQYFIQQLGASLGVDLSNSFDFFGVLYEDEDV